MRDLSILYGSLKTGFYSVFVQFKRADTVGSRGFRRAQFDPRLLFGMRVQERFAGRR